MTNITFVNCIFKIIDLAASLILYGRDHGKSDYDWKNTLTYREKLNIPFENQSITDLVNKIYHDVYDVTAVQNERELDEVSQTITRNIVMMKIS